MKRLIIIMTSMLMAAALPRLALCQTDDNSEVLRDKTLVSWVTVDNTTQRGGSALTIGHGVCFDAIVFGECESGRWMAGSDMFRRTQADQSAYPPETANPSTLVQMAIVYEGKTINIYRDGQPYVAYDIDEPQVFSTAFFITMGLRHLGGPSETFTGSIDDARIYDRALTPEQIASLQPNEPSDIQPWAWWDFENGTATDKTGRFPKGDLFGDALIKDGRLILDGKNSYMLTQQQPYDYASPIHYRPHVGVFSDPIPFFWDGQYHVFYLLGGVGKVSWEHIVSNDLIHWKDLPFALVSGPDGMNMYTGSVIEKDGVFNIFYTGHNPYNPVGLEVVMHATSPDLIHWTKHPEDMIVPDEIHYVNKDHKNCRDPYVFWNETEKQYWMLIIADGVKEGHPVQGLLTSKDLKTWTQEPPIEGAEAQECPDLFKIGDYYYLIGGDHYASSKNIRGPYTRKGNSIIDAPGVYAGKRMFDGQRHIWTGWAWDTSSLRDEDRMTWGGIQCAPRELYAGPDGELYCRPAREVTAVYQHTIYELNNDPSPVNDNAHWQYTSKGLEATATSESANCVLDVPVSDAMIECEIQLDPQATFTLHLREQPETAEGYFLRINAKDQKVEWGSHDLKGKEFTWSRSCSMDASQPIRIQAFMQGTMMECFVNDAYAFTRRAYNFPEGKLGLSLQDGSVIVKSLTVKTSK